MRTSKYIVVAIIIIVVISVFSAYFILNPMKEVEVREGNSDKGASMPAQFEVTNLRINARAGRSVTILVDVRNKGDVSGTYTLILTINGVIESIKNITLTGGKIETVLFTVSKDKAGNYNVAIDNLTGTFTVIRPTVEILSHSSYYSRGYFHVVGEVQNTGNLNVEYVKIVATFYDAGGSVIGTDFAYTELDILLPGQKSPFELSSYPKQIVVDHYSLQVQFLTTSKVPYRELQILSHGLEIEHGYYKIIGEVQNIGSRTVEYVKIVATFYDSDGTVVGVDFTYTQLDILTPGQKSPFEISSYPRTASEMNVTSYALEFQCQIKY